MSDPIFADTLRKTYAELDQLQFVDALWARDLQMWTGDESTHRKIAGRLGWLGALDFVEPQLPRLTTFASDVIADGITDVVLLGMGGSSLAPEVLRQVLGQPGGQLRFRMLDSVDPDAVRAACAHPLRTLFVLASKSGGTIEPNAMAAEAIRALQAAGIADWNRRFVAITDEGTALHRRAQESGFRDIFVNPSDIGGRYSALSLFGLVPAALLGIDLDGFVAEARAMEQACRVSVGARNPGVILGAFATAGARAGRDKLTLLLPERLASFGLWVEQLVAESTGKQGRGVVPITGEAGPIAWGSDRLCVSVTMGSESPAPALLESARAAGVPLLELSMPGPLALGAEFLRWELATAVMGRLLEVNPFDEPNVQQAKDATGVLLAHYEATGALPVPASTPLTGEATVSLTTAAGNAAGERTPALPALGRAGDYLSIMAYLPPDDDALARPLVHFRAAAGAATGLPTMFGYGPRYLHSTGQLHKGGANNGVFVLVTASAAEDLPIPGAPYSFGVLEAAQALGDFRSLEDTGRRALLVRVSRRTPDAIAAALAALLS